MLVKIKKWGNSQGLRIPKSIIEDLGITEGEELEIFKKENKIIIEKKEKEITMKKLFKNYKDINREKELDWGKPQGKEEEF